MRSVLSAGWHIDATALRYEAVGGGSYHWSARDSQHRHWFVTVDDLDEKPWLGDTRTAVAKGLRAAMETAFALRHRAGLAFVLAPIPSAQGEMIEAIGSKYAAAVFPFIAGSARRFGEELPGRERRKLVDMLAALHQATPIATKAPRAQVSLPRRGDLESTLSELGRPWRGGPFAEPARALLIGAAGQIRSLLDAFDRMTEQVTAAPGPVLTHGEPHPANLIRSGTATMLIDWDTVGLGPPERDLWMVVSDTGDEALRYTNATGRAVDPVVLAFYRLRWGLDDLSCFAAELRADHTRTPHTEHAWRALKTTLSVTLPPALPAPSWP